MIVTLQLRGIKVIPEMNGPAHTNAGWQWSEKEGLGKLVLCTDNVSKLVLHETGNHLY